MHPLQEKLQVVLGPVKHEAAAEWAKATSNPHRMRSSGQQLPPGMDICEGNAMPISLAGETDLSCDTNTTSIEEGFTRRDMGNCDDQCTGEHVDAFYGDSGGFAERNNYLDRL